jgi:uncharacterized membrane protein
MLPPMPSWDGLHPIIVHFPIALLLIAPVLVVLGLAFFKSGKAFMYSAFLMMLIGTVAAVVAVATGEAAGELAERVTNAEAVLENHEELAETTRNVFAALTVVFGAIVFVPLIFRRELAAKIAVPLNIVFLLFYGAGTVVLLNAAHEGGRLVHEFGVRAAMDPARAGTTGPVSPRKGDDDDD